VSGGGRRVGPAAPATNAPDHPPADVYTGVILPDGATLVYFSAPGVVGGSVPIAEAYAMQPMQTLAPGASVSVPAVMDFSIPAGGIAPGTYQFFAVLIPHGALVGGAMPALVLHSVTRVA